MSCVLLLVNCSRVVHDFVRKNREGIVEIESVLARRSSDKSERTVSTDSSSFKYVVTKRVREIEVHIVSAASLHGNGTLYTVSGIQCQTHIFLGTCCHDHHVCGVGTGVAVGVGTGVAVGVGIKIALGEEELQARKSKKAATDKPTEANFISFSRLRLSLCS